MNRIALYNRLVKLFVACTVLGFLFWVALPGTAWGEESYVVKRGDTLFGIAHKYGVSTADLAEHNGLSASFHVLTGQRLSIPTRTKRRHSPAASSSALPRSVQRAIDRAKVKPGRWRYIVIHHSGVDTGTVKSMDRYHREVRHMENGLAYHFVIGNGSGMRNGEIAVCHRWKAQLAGGHLANEAQNQIAIGICLVGNFDVHRPSAKQMASLKALVQALLVRCRLTPKAVKTHRQINVVPTRCPGAHFPTTSFLRSLRSH